MKLTIVVLVVLGLVAAMCAVLLVNLWPVIFSDEDKTVKREITVLVATHAIPIHTELKSGDFEQGMIDLSQQAGDYANANAYYRDPIYVLGRVVNSDISAGQAITKDKVITDPDIATVLKALKPGMRAVSVRLSGDQISGGLLYPGCFVDVLAQFSTRGGSSGNSGGEAVSKIFLERIKVIAVKGELAAQTQLEAEGKTSGPKKTPGGSGLTITLVVATEQVESLQLATERGSISLTLRNPLDDIAVNSRGTVLDPSKMTVFSDFFAPPPNKDQNLVPGSVDETGFPKQKIEVIRGNQTTLEVVMSSEPQTDQKTELLPNEPILK